MRLLENIVKQLEKNSSKNPKWVVATVGWMNYYSKSRFIACQNSQCENGLKMVVKILYGCRL